MNSIEILKRYYYSLSKRNFRARNFGLGSSSMSKALYNAYCFSCHSDNSKRAVKSVIKKFCECVSHVFGIKNLNKIKKEHVLYYAETLKDDYLNGELSIATIQNYLSRINVALFNARGDKKCHVDPVKEANFPKRNFIAICDNSTSLEKHVFALNSFSPDISMMIRLQRKFGLRFRESALLDCDMALKSAISEHYIKVQFGTKGGRPRVVPITHDSQIDLLNEAALYQGEKYNFVPDNLSFVQFKNRCYREANQIGFKFHEERHHYANSRYKVLLGVDSPVRSGKPHGKEHHKYLAEKLEISNEAAKILDLQVRLIIAEELGHSRAQITNAYLG